MRRSEAASWIDADENDTDKGVVVVPVSTTAVTHRAGTTKRRKKSRAECGRRSTRDAQLVWTFAPSSSRLPDLFVRSTPMGGLGQ